MKIIALLLLAVAAHAEMDAQTYIKKEMAEQKGEKMLWTVASGTNRRDVLNLLALNPDERTRWSVALNVNASIGALRRLATDPSPRIREAVAAQLWRPLPDDVQWTLSNDSDIWVMKDLAVHSTVPDILEKIRARYSDDGEILWELAVNSKHADNVTMQKIAHCRFHEAAEVARRALKSRGMDFSQVYEEKVVGIKR